MTRGALAPDRDRLVDLTGRNALVTGASRGVGRATAVLLARAGAAVAVAYRSRGDAAEETVRAVEEGGGTAWSVAADLSRPEQVEALFREADRRFEGLDVVVANAAVWPSEDVPLARMEPERWRRTLATNLDSVFHTARLAAARLRDDGRLVVVSSTAAVRGEAFHADYAASKAALHGLVKSLCGELAPRGVTVNAVAPGWIDTDMARPALEGPHGERIRRSIPLGRVASAEDVAGPVLFLCSALARHVTGEILNVNGGAVLAG